MYYNPYPYYVYVHQYPNWGVANSSFPHHLPGQLAMPTSPNPNQYPPINTLKLKTSAKQIQPIMQQAQLLTEKIEGSDQFAHDLKNAAQLSKQDEVQKLISSAGVTAKFEAKYTPDNIRIVLSEGGCCSIAIILYW
ncbi:hypothetical protein JNUCC52_15025 [Lysinibacillus sp. JNUCC-52]|nr:hypothetical protein JNUCC52_15025 [Lysinibacillus sp. JNUCC-52]